MYTSGKSLSHFLIIIVWSNSRPVLYIVFDIISKICDMFRTEKLSAIKIKLPDDSVVE